MQKILLFAAIIGVTGVLVKISAQTPERFGGDPQFRPDQRNERGPAGFGPRDRDEMGRGGPPGFGPGGPREDLKIVKDFDRNEDGWLNREERDQARKVVQSTNEGRRGFGPPGGGPRGLRNREPAVPGRKLSPDEVEKYPNTTLYDPAVLRTVFFEFENEDWERELEEFHGTDVDVAAKMIVDGKTYPNVGMRFRGMSSYGMVPTGFKRSFNVSIDMADKDAKLYGYKTLNLLNSSGDPSFMSTVLYSHIASQYIPVPKANHVHVVINGESWGIYVNVQQFNKDFLSEHFDSTKGTRWKVSGSPGGDGGLRYLGEDLDQYKQRFEMKSNDGKKAWTSLVVLSRTLNESPIDELEYELEPMLDIDATLRFLALDVALVNSDGYWTRASDFSLFLDKDGKFHIFPHDMNEAFQSGHGPGGMGGPPLGGRGFAPPPRGVGGAGRNEFPPRPGDDRERFARDRDNFRGPDGEGPRSGRSGFRGPGGGGGGPGHGGVDLDPLVAIDNPRMPLRSRLLAVPSLRKKYLQYVHEIAEKSLDWNQVEPVLSRHVALIQNEVALDSRKLDSLEAFQQSTSPSSLNEANADRSLRSFFEQRRKYLLDYREPIQ